MQDFIFFFRSNPVEKKKGKIQKGRSYSEEEQAGRSNMRLELPATETLLGSQVYNNKLNLCQASMKYNTS